MTSRVPVLTAVADPALEAALVAGLSAAGSGIAVARRCVDLAELLAAAAGGSAAAALVSDDLRGLDTDSVARLGAAGVAVVGVVAGWVDGAGRSGPGGSGGTGGLGGFGAEPAPPTTPAATRLARIGIRHVVGARALPPAVLAAVQAALADTAAVPPAPALAGQRGVPVSGPVAPPPGPRSRDVADLADVPGADSLPDEGQIVAVWGPTGAPGRSTVACGIAAELALLGCSVLLVDADTYGGSISQQLGLAEDTPGLAAAARAASHGLLDAEGLARQVRRVSLTGAAPLGVLTGLVRADRWPEIGEPALARVLELARGLARRVVVDVGFCLEADEALSYDLPTARRNGATLATLTAADTVLAVGSADPVGLARLIRGLAELAAARPDAAPRAVVNRLRREAVAGDPAREVRAALARHSGVEVAALLPEDRAAADRAAALGRLLAEAAPASRLRAALRELAGELAPADLAGAAARGRRRRMALRRA